MRTLEGIEWSGKRIMIVGLARSGLAAADLLLQAGAIPVLYDAKRIEELASKDHIMQLIEAGCVQGMGLDPFALLLTCDIMLVSPAVPVDAPLIHKAKEKNIPVIGELELGALFSKGPIYAVTGTNGKTTTVSILGEMFKHAGIKAIVCGNIGYPVARAVMEANPGDPLVVEVSSFQLETASVFHPRAAVVTNISPDHLDRHGSMERYVALKQSIFLKQTNQDFAVLNADDAAVSAMQEGLKSEILLFSSRSEVRKGVFVLDDQVILRYNDQNELVCQTSDIKLPGNHNLQNVLAAIALAAVAGISIEAMKKAVTEFGGVEHRIEVVTTIKGITYINDSKGTNPESTMKAIMSMKHPTVLLAGGYDKKVSFAELAEAIANCPMIIHTVLYGQTADQLKNSLHQVGFISTSNEKDMISAINRARSIPGFKKGNILLSPACASFDQFNDYEQRGMCFKQYVLSLSEESDVRTRL